MGGDGPVWQLDEVYGLFDGVWKQGNGVDIQQMRHLQPAPSVVLSNEVSSDDMTGDAISELSVSRGSHIQRHDQSVLTIVGILLQCY